MLSQYLNIKVTGVKQEPGDKILTQYSLKQNYPNPFNPITRISWQCSSDGWQTLKIYNALGNEIETLVNEKRPAGNYEIEFNAKNLTSGVYFYTLKAGLYSQTKKMILLK